MENNRSIKIALVGNAKSGKTALFKRYVENAFEDKNAPTMKADFIHKKIVHDSQNITLQIWDLPGDESFQSVHADYKGMNAYLVCIDLTEANALDSAAGWVKAIKNITEISKVPILLVGTKADLIDEDEKQAKEQTLKNLVSKQDCSGYFITSAKVNEQVDQVFTKVADLVKLQQNSISELRENVVYSAYEKIRDKKPKHERLSFWQRHVRKIIAGIIIGTFVAAAITLSLVLPVTVPFLASLGLTIPFTGPAGMAALAGIGAAVGLVAGSVIAGIIFGIEALIRFCRRKEELTQSENTSSKNLTVLKDRKNNRSVLNPFKEVIETSNHVLRTNLKQKIADTFFVFTGTLFTKRNDHIGLFDYATLMIPFYIQGLAYSCWRNVQENIASKILIAPVVFIATPFTLARYVVSGILTVVALPFIFVTHLISKIVSHKFKKQLDSLPITVNAGNTNKEEESKSTLGEYLRKNNMNLEDINNVDFVDSYKKITLTFQSKKTEDTVFSCEFISSADEAVRSKFASLLALNVGKLATKNSSEGHASLIQGSGAHIDTKVKNQVYTSHV